MPDPIADPPLSASEVSVCISTMERPEALRRCLQAVWSGALRPLEIVVVDQSRDDRTEQVIRDAQSAGIAVRRVGQPPKGLGASQNEAVRQARGVIVAITDDDCVVDARWLAVIVQSFADDPELGALGGRVLPLPGESDRTWPVSSRISTQRVDFTPRGLPWDVGSGNNFAVRRALFLKIGGCDERLGPGSPGLGGVDMDLFYRLLRSGARVCYEPDALVHHERQTLAERQARRPLYGHGMGAALALRWREGDRTAARLLVHWAGLRLGMMARAMRRCDWTAAQEEMVMLRSTMRGARHGLRAADRRPDSNGGQHE